MDRVSLNWTVVSQDPGPGEGGGGGAWCVIATHPEQLKAVADALGRPQRRGAIRDQWTSCGTVDGRRLATHLGAWSAAVGLLAAPGNVDALRETLELLRGLAGGVDLCRWRLARPSDKVVCLEADITLSPPASSQ